MIDNFLITKNKTIKNAMRMINVNQHKCLVVVDKHNKLIGTLSDGNIRRALLKNYNLDDKINNIYNKNPKFIFKKKLKKEKLKNLFIKKNFDLIPILQDNRKVIDVTYWSKVFNFEQKINKKRNSKQNILVVIMAGGEGTRMKPFTNVLPKPLIPINDKPVIKHIMDKFIMQGISNFIFTINHKAEIIKAYFKELKSKNKISFINEKTPLGTAGSLKVLQNKINNSFFVINCDTIVNINYNDLYDFHLKNKNMITIIASAKEHIIPYGICNLSATGQLKNIEEKPKFNFLANAGIYVVHPSVLKLIPKNKRFDFPELIIAAKKRKIRIGVFPIDDNSWSDIGQWSEYKKTLNLLRYNDE